MEPSADLFLKKRKKIIIALNVVFAVGFVLGLKVFAESLLKWLASNLPNLFVNQASQKLIVFAIVIGGTSLFLNFVMIIYPLVLRFIWRCPHCKSPLGTLVSLNFCFACGVSLTKALKEAKWSSF